MRNKYEIKAKGERAELTIYGDIGADWFAEESNDAKSIKDKIDALSGDIDVRINSYGGVVSDGLAIFNALKRHDGKVTTYIDGVAYSIASLIAMAGDEIKMASNALMMVHAPWGGLLGNAQEMRDMADVLDKLSEAMVSSYAARVDADTARGWLTDGEDHYFTASEAIEQGLADTVENSTDVASIAAALRENDRFKRFPKAAVRRPLPSEEQTMSDEIQGAGGAPDDDYVTKHNKTVKAATMAGAKIESKRRKTIEDVFAAFYTGDDLDPVTAARDECLDDINCDELQARRKLSEILAAKSADPVVHSAQYGLESTYQAPPNVSRHIGGAATISHAAEDKRAKGLQLALEIKAGLVKDYEVVQREERSNEFMAASLTEIMAYELRQMGQVVAGTREHIAKQYLMAQPIMAAGPSHGTGHLTGILADVANKSAMMGWDGAEETWRMWTMEGRLNDYREAQRANLALLDTLDKMYEGQEWEYGDLADVKQGIQGYFHGKKYGLTIQAIVNDDLGELTRAFNAWGEAASTTVGDAVLALLTSGSGGSSGYGQTMDEDSVVLFHSTHSNYVASSSGGAPSETTLNAGYVAMATQTDPNSRTVGIRPRYILHGATLASTVYRQLVSEKIVSGSTSGEPEANWVRSLGLTPVQEYRLDSQNSGLAWILAAGRRTIEVSGVAGPLVPRVERSMTSNIPGITYEMSLPFGCAALDYRGFYYNHGS